MKNIILLLLFVCSSMISIAQGKNEKAVAAAVEKLRQAMIDPAKSKLDNLVTDNLSYGHSSGHIDNKEKFVEKIVTGKSDFVTIDLTEQTISVSRKTAIVRHILRAKTNDNGKPGDVQLRVILVWQKQGGKWKLMARQAVKMS